jgi:tetratricopeptide (TPR) repeat protein
MGDQAGALASYERAIAIRLQLVQTDPTNTDRQYDLALAYDRLGELQEAIGDLAGARTSFERSLVIHQQLAEAKPSSANARSDLASSYNALCWLESIAGAAGEALPLCDRAVDLGETRRDSFRDSRGLARALTGDTLGAIDDFNTFVGWAEGQPRYAQMVAERRAWIAQLQAGQNPFHTATLDALRNE